MSWTDNMLGRVVLLLCLCCVLLILYCWCFPKPSKYPNQHVRAKLLQIELSLMVLRAYDNNVTLAHRLSEVTKTNGRISAIEYALNENERRVYSSLLKPQVLVKQNDEWNSEYNFRVRKNANDAYEYRIWSNGPNRVNEYGGGDDILVYGIFQ